MEPKEVKQTLIKARSLIEKPENWLQGSFSCDAEGNHCFATEENAVCFCSLGAVERAINETIVDYGCGADVYAAARELLQVKMGTSAIKFNDSHTHQEVLAKFDEAIKYLEQ